MPAWTSIRTIWTAATLHRACERLEADGVGGFLATIITDDLGGDVPPAVDACGTAGARILLRTPHCRHPHRGSVSQRARRVSRRASARRDSAGRRRFDVAARSMPPRGLTRVVTLAPERDGGFAVTRYLAHAGIIVSAGHTDATLDELRARDRCGPVDVHACRQRLSDAACTATTTSSSARSVWRIICGCASSRMARTCRLPRWATTCASRGRIACIVVTDAIAPAGLGPGRYTFGRWDLVIGDDMVPRAPDRSHFVGSGHHHEAECGEPARRLGLPELSFAS